MKVHKVEDALLNPNGWHFPYISQTIHMDLERLANYRASAKGLLYDTNTGNITEEISYGEVASVDCAAHTFSSNSASAVYTFYTYSILSNQDIKNKLASITVFGDAAGSAKISQKLFFYNANGSITNQQEWLNTANNYLDVLDAYYDVYGNPTITVNGAGVVTRKQYDSATATFAIFASCGVQTNLQSVDARSGQIMLSTNQNGLVSSNAFDVFLRPIGNYISTVPYGAPALWKRKVDYVLGGIGGPAVNYIHTRTCDGVDVVNGLETYEYRDGLERTIQQRQEGENNQFRITDTFFEASGKSYYRTLPYFGSSASYSTRDFSRSGIRTDYDAIGRPSRVTAPTGDVGSPSGYSQIQYVDGTDPWTTVVTDPAGKQMKKGFDAFGRSVQVTEVTSLANYITRYSYDKTGNLTNVVDSSGNNSFFGFDSMKRQISAVDPDLGTWTYGYDAGSRLTSQIDANGQKVTFDYNDISGRPTAKHIYNSQGTLVATCNFTYDFSDDPAYTGCIGQIYKISDREGWQKFGYDSRGRTVKKDRYLSINSQEYVTQIAYDDADRITTLTYPQNTASLRYRYDSGGNLTNIVSLSGTGTQENFYSATSFTEVGQPLSTTFGNGQQTSFGYYANTKRVQSITAVKPGNAAVQNLSYTYDIAGSVASVTDSASGHVNLSSSTISGTQYDDLHRLTQATIGGVTKNYSYDGIGNIVTNGDNGSGRYYYASNHPHAVTNANGKTYSYDRCGNMVSRGSQTLVYDEENRLNVVSGNGGPTVTFGYSESGVRLWRNSTSYGTTIWIDDIFEVNGGKTLCHVFGGTSRIASFEPQGGVFGSSIGSWLIDGGRFINRVAFWPLQDGRAPITVLTFSLLGTLVFLTFTRRNARLSQLRRWRPVGHFPVWRQALGVFLVPVLVVVTTNTNVNAQTYSPVFYYYHPDILGSSNVVTDRSGQMVQHIEYNVFGSDRFQDNTLAFGFSNRYTGQVCDNETGLYYYKARYYDPQLGRFIQPDTVLNHVDSPQNLNRYSYVNNNPLTYMDPTGHFVELLVPLIVMMVMGAAAGAVSAAVNGGDIAMGALTGAIMAGCTSVMHPVIGGAVGGAICAAINGQDVGKGALAGAITGGIVCYVSIVTTEYIQGVAAPAVQQGTANSAVGQAASSAVQHGIANPVLQAGAAVATAAAGGAASGAIVAELSGTDPGEGAEWGAASGAITGAAKWGGNKLWSATAASASASQGFIGRVLQNQYVQLISNSIKNAEPWGSGLSLPAENGNSKLRPHSIQSNQGLVNGQGFKSLYVSGSDFSNRSNDDSEQTLWSDWASRVSSQATGAAASAF